MAVTLHTLLQAALDQESRRPVVTATSSSPDGSAIPFIGQKLDGQTTEAERFPSGILHSTGRYICVYSRTTTTNGDLYFKTTDTNRSTWSAPVKITAAGASEEYLFPAIVEMGNTNKDIGIVFTFRTSTGGQQLKFMVVNTSGVQVTAVTTIDAGSASVFWYEPAVVKWSDDNTYTMVCPKLTTPSTWDMIRFTHAATAGGASWTTWTNAGAMTFSGGDDVTGEKRRPCLKEVTTSGGTQHWIAFDRVEGSQGTLKRTNCYYAKNGTKLTGSNSTTKFTTASSTNFNNSYQDPSIAQPSGYASNTMAVSYTKLNTSMLLTTTTTPALQANSARYVEYDASADYIIFADRGSAGSGGSLNGVTVIKAATLEIYRRYYRQNQTTGSTPPLGNNASIVAFAYSFPHVVVAWNSLLGVTPASKIDVIDIQSNTVSSFYGPTVPEDTIGTGSYRMTIDVGSIQSVAIEGSKIWLVNQFRGSSPSEIGQIYSIDFGTAQGKSVEPRYIGYAFPVPLDTNRDLWVQAANQQNVYWDIANKIGYFSISMNNVGVPAAEANYGTITKIDLETGALIDKWNRSNTTNFPRAGAYVLAKTQNRIYFAAKEHSLTSGDLKGVGWVPDIDLSHNAPTMTVADPFNVAEANTAFERNCVKPMGDGRVMVGTKSAGMGVWDGAATPIVYDEAFVAGMPTTGGNPVSVRDMAYDGARKRFYFAHYQHDQTTNGGLLIFDLDGDLLQPMYSIFTSLNTTPVTPNNGGTETRIVQGDEDEQVSLMPNSTGSSLAAFWAKRVSSAVTTSRWPSNASGGLSEYDVYFDEDLGSIDLTPYLTGEVVVTQNIEHQPNRIEFTVARGDLFDPTNSRSVLRNYLDQGRKVVFQKGEICSDGITRTTDLFTGFIESGAIQYKKGSHPVRSVVAYDVTKPAYDFEIRVSAAYGFGGASDPPGTPDGDGTPGAGAGIISHMAQSLAGLTSSEVSIGSFSNSQSIRLQLVNMSPADMMEVVANRFQRVIYVNNSGVLTTKQIQATPTVTATEDKLTQTNNLVQMNPDESEGETTNRVTVRGVTDEELNLTYPYSFMMIADSSGLMGVRFGVYDMYKFHPYSDDYSVTAINPKTDFTYKLIGRDSSTDRDINSIVWFEFVPMTAELVLQMGFATNAAASAAGAITPEQIATFLQNRGALIHFYFAGAVPLVIEFDYVIPIFAQKIGTIRQEIQASADDIQAQRKMRNLVIERIVDFPAAQSTAICQTMADWFLLRVKLQRKLVRLTLAGHLRHEPGDVIEFKHPESTDMLKAIVHQVVRRFQFGAHDLEELTLGIYE